MASTDHLRVEEGKFLTHLKPEQKLSNPQIELESAKMLKKRGWTWVTSLSVRDDE